MNSEPQPDHRNKLKEAITFYAATTLGMLTIATIASLHAFRRRGDPVPEEIPPANRKAWAEAREKELDLQDQLDAAREAGDTKTWYQLHDQSQEAWRKRFDLEAEQ